MSRSVFVSLLAGLLWAGVVGAQAPCNPPSGPPSTYRAGLTDGFTPPVEPASRRAALDAAFPTARWIGFDDGTRDRFVGHSFTGLPAGVVKAEVVIRMRPAGGGSSNDVLHLGLNSAGSFAFSSAIRDLPGAGGRWDTTPGVTFTMNLASLPGGGNILSKVASDRALDLLVQDDTTVDFVQLRVWTCPPRTLSFGLPLTAVGQARLEVDDLGRLAVSNLGPSGQDGFEISLGESQGANIEGLVDLSLLTDGTRLTITTLGVREGVPGQPVGILRETVSFALGVNQVEADFSMLGTTSYTVRALRAGEIIDQASGLARAEASYAAVARKRRNKCGNKRCMNPDHQASITFPDGPIPVAIAGRPPVEADEIELLAENPRLRVDAITSERLQVAGVPGFVITSFEVVQFERSHKALGSLLLEPFDGGLAAAQIGTTGQDGVSIDLGEAQSAEISLVPLDLAGAVPNGSFIEASATGSVNGTQEQSLGSLRLTQTEEGVLATADFSAIQSSTQRVQVLSGGSVVADLPGRTGPIGTISRWFHSLGKLGGQTECYVSRYPENTVFGIGGAVYSGDELRVLAENSPSTIDFKSDFAVRASGIPEFTITDAVVGTECEPGPTHLCLNKGRFKVETRWQTPNGLNGAGRAVQLTPDTGYFWFFGSSNVEMVLKVLDACGVNQRFWVFAGGLTNVAVETTVTDTATGAVQVYRNPQGTAFQPLQDTGAFATCEAPLFQPFQDTGGLWPTTAADSSLLLNNSRFRVEVEWATGDGSSGEGEAVPLTSDTGYFWFFNEENVELVIKVLNGCGLNSRYWVFAGGLTNVRTRITVTDTLRGNVRTYENPQGTPFQPLQDTSAFATCP